MWWILVDRLGRAVRLRGTLQRLPATGDAFCTGAMANGIFAHQRSAYSRIAHDLHPDLK